MLGLFKKKRPPALISAVIAAAGAGARMEGIDKQLILLDGVPAVARGIARFCECPYISEIIIVCRREEIASYLHMAQDFGLDKVTSVVAGGGQRQDSVFAGIAACSQKSGYFAIHDGARPLVSARIIEDCVFAAISHGAAAAGVPVKDTIKVAGKDGFVVSTPDRTSLYAIQTPQIFEAGLYRSAMAHAMHFKRYYTDDCQLVEQTGKRVFISKGGYENIKITTPEDIALASAILAFKDQGVREL